MDRKGKRMAEQIAWVYYNDWLAQFKTAEGQLKSW